MRGCAHGLRDGRQSFATGLETGMSPGRDGPGDILVVLDQLQPEVEPQPSQT
jgi:hypothetical protein